MDNLLINLDWQEIGSVVLLIVSVTMIILFKRSPSDRQQTLKLGIGFFILSFSLNIIGLTAISDYIGVLGLIVVTIALISLFWSDSSKIE